MAEVLRLGIEQLELEGVYPLGTYWLKEEWQEHLQYFRSKLLVLIEVPEKGVPIAIGSVVYDHMRDHLQLLSCIVHEALPAEIFQYLIEQLIQSISGSSVTRIVAHVEKRDTAWRNLLEGMSFQITGSMYTQSGEDFYVYTYAKP